MCRVRRMLIGLVALSAVVAACGGDDGGGVRNIGTGADSESGSGLATAQCEAVGDMATADVEADVELSEWLITAPAEIAAGSVGFVAKNIGGEAHELVVIRAASAADLPLDADGALDEEGLEPGALVGEIEPFPAGETCTGVFDLEPGGYVLVCNIVESLPDGTVESHLAEGMVTEVTVT